MKAIVTITANLNSIALTAKKGQTFEAIKETEKSFTVLVDGKERMVSKKFAAVLEPKKKTGVIKTIIKTLREGSKTKSMLLDILEAEFPERERTAMLKTLNAQLGFGIKEARIEREQKISLQTERIAKDVFFSIA